MIRHDTGSEIIDRGLWLDLYITGAPPDADRSLSVKTRPSPEETINTQWDMEVGRAFRLKYKSVCRKRTIR